MRTKGSPNLTKEKRVVIKAQKNLRLTTQKQIAEDNGVAEMTVRQIERNMTEEDLEQAAQLERDHKIDIKRVRNKALDRLEEAIDKGTLKTEALIPAYGTLYDKFRLETGQATQINQESNSPDYKLKRALATFLDMEVGGNRPTYEQALVAISRMSIDGVGEEVKARFIEGERKRLLTQ